MLLKLTHTLKNPIVSLTNGPGFRWSVWMQGCSLRCCNHCINPEMLDPKGGYAFSISELIEVTHRLMEKRFYSSFNKKMVPIEGVTLLGGEPTDQAEALIPFCMELQKLNLSVMLYSGHYYDTLKNHQNRFLQAFLMYVDILLDGPYIDALYDDTLMWRGSSNQNIHLLSDKYTREHLEKIFKNQGKVIQFQYSDDFDFNVSGSISGTQAETLNKMMRNNRNYRINDS